jgi:mannose/cellobiose epimerase-like protein (N-acyl-D-glucosamine 2-epimerase family)
MTTGDGAMPDHPAAAGAAAAVGSTLGWFFDRVMPDFARRLPVPAGGYAERLTSDGRPIVDDFCSTLVTARLVYAFSHAHMLSSDPAIEAAARHGYAFLLDRCIDGGKGLFRHRVSRTDDSVFDARIDLYDHAFVLFALAWFARAFGQSEPADRALQVFERIEALLRDDAHGGYREDDRGSTPRRQNPHMHLLEACHALLELTGNAVWHGASERLVGLFLDRFFDRETGSLGEFFTADWRPIPGDPGRWREPGHHMEWVWLLLHHHRLTGNARVLVPAERLHAFARRFGVGVDGLLIDAVDRDGTPLTSTRLLWPQTEALKAALARTEHLGDLGAPAEAARLIRAIRERYIVADDGTWANQLDEDGASVAGPVPVRVLYHLMLAFAEAARLRNLWAAE